MTKADINKYISKKLDTFCDWIHENEFNMRRIGVTDYDEMKAENIMLEMFRTELTIINNMVNDIKEA